MSSINGGSVSNKSLNNNTLFGDIQIEDGEMSGISNLTADRITAIISLTSPEVSSLLNKTTNITYLNNSNTTYINGNLIVSGITTQQEDIIAENLDVINTTNLNNCYISSNLFLKNVNVDTRFLNIEANVLNLQTNNLNVWSNLNTVSSRLVGLEVNNIAIWSNLNTVSNRLVGLETNNIAVWSNLNTVSSRLVGLEVNNIAVWSNLNTVSSRLLNIENSHLDNVSVFSSQLSNLITNNIAVWSNLNTVSSRLVGVEGRTSNMTHNNNITTLTNDFFLSGTRSLWIGNSPNDGASQKFRLHQSGATQYIDISGNNLLNFRGTTSPVIKHILDCSSTGRLTVNNNSLNTTYNLYVNGSSKIENGLELNNYVGNANTRSFLLMNTNRSGVYSRIGRHATATSSTTLFSVNLNRDTGNFRKDNVLYPAHYFSMSESGTINMGYLNNSNTAVDMINMDTTNELTTLSANINLSYGNVFIGSHLFTDNFKNNISVANCMTIGKRTDNNQTVVNFPLESLTSNNQNGYVVYASADGNNAYKAFDGNISTIWACSSSLYTGVLLTYTGTTSTILINDDNVMGEFIDLKIPFNVQPSGLTIQQNFNNNLIREFYILGSDNGNQYEKLGFFNGQSNTFIDVNITTTIKKRYNYLRLVVWRLNQGSPILNIGYINFKGYRIVDNYLTHIPHSLEVGQSYEANIINPNYNFIVNGDSLFNGRIKTTQSGVVLNELVFGYLLGNLSKMMTTLNATNTYTTLFGFNHTPISDFSTIIIYCDLPYTIDGYGPDNFYCRITYGGTQVVEKIQVYQNGAGGGTRSSVLTPISCAFLNNDTIKSEVLIQFKNSSDADTMYFNRNDFIIRITELSR